MSCMSVATLAENLSFLSKYADFEARIRFGFVFYFFSKQEQGYLLVVSLNLLAAEKVA